MHQTMKNEENIQSLTVSHETRQKMKTASRKRWKNVKIINRDRILQTAEELFQKNGYTDTTFKDIQKHANLSKATLYKYFNNKDELFLAICSRSMQTYYNLINKHLQEEDFQFQGLTKGTIMFILDYPFYAEILNGKTLLTIFHSFTQKRQEGKAISQIELEFNDFKMKVEKLMHNTIQTHFQSLNRPLSSMLRNSMVAVVSAMIQGTAAEFIFRRIALKQSKERIHNDLTMAFNLLEIGLNHYYN